MMRKDSTNEQGRNRLSRQNLRTTLLIAGLMVISAAIGAFVAIDSGSIPFGIAGPDDVVLGADTPPVTAGAEVTALNDAFVAVSKGVTPQVVSITVTSAIRPSSRGEVPFDDPFGMFRFPDRGIPQQGSGSGVIVTSDGYIITNNHVVSGAAEDGIQVEMIDGSQFGAELVGSDPTTDLAVLKVDAEGLPAAAIGSSDDLQVGQIVFAVGNPLGLNSTVTQGIVSAIGRGQLNLNVDAQGYGIEDFIQTDAAINPGNSGGGLFNIDGELIGINAAIATQTGYSQGYGFAIPIDLAVAVARDLIEDGRVNRGYIGVAIKGVDQKLADYLDLEVGDGVLIEAVQEGSAAEAAGLKQGDIILSIDEESISTPNQLQSLIARKRVGDEVALKVFRFGDTFEKTVRLRARADDEVVADRRGFDAPRGSEREPAETIDGIGLELDDLSSREQRIYDVDEGVVVRGVEIYGEAFEQGLREGDLILSVNRERVSSLEEVEKILDDIDNGEIVLFKVRRVNGMESLVAVEMQR